MGVARQKAPYGAYSSFLDLKTIWVTRTGLRGNRGRRDPISPKSKGRKIDVEIYKP